MDLGSIFLILALAVLVSLFISRPLFDRQSEETPLVVREAEVKADHERSSLLAEQERLLNALQELDFDYTLGKIPAEDYPVQRTAYLQSGVSILQRLDAFKGSPAGAAVSDSEAAQQLEKVIAARRADSEVMKTGSLPVPAGEDVVEDLIAARRRSRRERFGGFCANCGRPLQKSDVFCSHCGTKNL